MVRVRVVRRRTRTQRPGRIHVVHVRAGVLSLRDEVVQHQRRSGDARRSANGRHGHGRHWYAVGQRQHHLHGPVRSPQDLASVR